MPDAKAANSSARTPWFIYIVRCRDGSLYTGITTDLARRIAEHNGPRGGARYTRPRRPVTMVYKESAETRALATKRERQIKKLSPVEKNRLAALFLSNPSAHPTDPPPLSHPAEVFKNNPF